MAALFQGIMRAMPYASEPTESTEHKPHSHSLIHSPRSYHMPAYPMASEWDERQRRCSVAGGVHTTEGRIAHWDKKREKCTNCKHIYLKTLSRHPGFCSVDCKSNAAYVDKVNRTIKAVRCAVEHLQQQEDDKSHESQQSDSGDDCQGVEGTQAATFAEYGLEARLPADETVAWAFSY